MLSGADTIPKTGLPPETIVVNMEINMFWDGLFHVLTWTMTVAGLTMLWRAGKRRKFRGRRELFSADFPSDGDCSILSKASSTITSCTFIT